MVKIALQITCRLDNIEELKPGGPEFRWCLKFTCSNCGQASEKWNYVSLEESTPMQRGSGVNNFVIKCKLCSRENSMTIMEHTIKSFTLNDQGKFKAIVTFDCRGMEPSDFSAREGWTAQTIEGGREFSDVDLSEGEWEYYCDETLQPVGIYEIKHRFEKIK
ncbi:UPF0587 protein C1orf123 homolog [Harpegnathos saltator]|uniref:UPF0587 protein C1orf123-like protein n=1 Tax=Harpegnathos saltator TaxID=610380 RepID=E2BCK1_HARSA|nr:UPF0587 protein C1orf123 homolog [Harpegnathos saltator]EFN86576.1 UPF0587 protein C1orf123-like protein [Harpegnathos saltator]